MLKEKYQQVTTPQELSLLMDGLKYGYIGKSGKIHIYSDKDFNDVWYTEYLLSSPMDVLTTGVGNCWDQTELERDWFHRHGYNYKTIYEMIEVPYENSYPTHSFLIFEDEEGNWNWFENSDFTNRGIHTYPTVDLLLADQLTKYRALLETFGITKEELDCLKVREFSKPKTHSTVDEYLEFVQKSPILDDFLFKNTKVDKTY